jgi:NADPH:quinone reductase-like Zn-dependent oxidoreductase
MRVLVNTKPGGPEVLRLEERPTPTPAAREVLIAVKRSGLNFADVAARVGLYPDAPPFPMVVGYEVSGQVAAVGAEVAEFREGDRVLAITRFQGHASHVCVPSFQVRSLPSALSFDEGAALPVNGLTAVHMLSVVAPLRPGMRVLVHSAAGGVGTCLVQLAKTVEGIELFGTASSAKHDFLRGLGVHHPIDPRQLDYVFEVRRLTGGKGVDRVFDALGGPDWRRGFSLLRPGGHLVCFGWANMVAGRRRRILTVAAEFLRMPRFTPLELMDANRAVSGVNMGHLFGDAELVSPHMTALLAAATDGRLTARIDSVFPLSKAAQAHERLQSRQSIGKVLFDCEAD